MIEDSAANATRVAAPVVARIESRHVEMPVVAPVVKENALKNIALFIAAPFIGLVYAMLLPFVGLGLLTKLAAEALVKKYPAMANVFGFVKAGAKIVAAPFVGLAFILALPFVGMATLAWVGIRGLANKARAG